ncbi:hypothetical protein C2S51_015915 [Perilla frutescens var. frutescens]|nr:hypothetical protein C2S51_015915 [Perilla frutescens var. frutescens]
MRWQLLHWASFRWMWASIALSTILIRTLHLPFKIHQLKAVSKFTLIQPQLDEIEDEIESGDKSPVAVALLEARKKKLLNEYGIKPFTNWASFVTVFPVAFLFFNAIVNMVDKVESFKEGGAFWFTDLTTPDAMYILPALTVFTFWMAMECHNDPLFSRISRRFNVILAALTFPLAAFAPKEPEVKKKLGIPDVELPPYSISQPLVLPPSFAEWLPALWLFPMPI